MSNHATEVTFIICLTIIVIIFLGDFDLVDAVVYKLTDGNYPLVEVPK